MFAAAQTSSASKPSSTICDWTAAARSVVLVVTIPVTSLLGGAGDFAQPARLGNAAGLPADATDELPLLDLAKLDRHIALIGAPGAAPEEPADGVRVDR